MGKQFDKLRIVVDNPVFINFQGGYVATIKPMLAVHADIEDIKYPVAASPKLDGIRGLILNGALASRSLKKFPNKHTQGRYSHSILDGLDGEFILGSPVAPDSYRVTNSALMQHEGTPDVKMWVFDDLTIPRLRFEKRLGSAEEKVNKAIEAGFNIEMLDQVLVETPKELLEWEEHYLSLGFEGLILRDLNSPYKFGRSTINERGMLKFKRMRDSEAEVLGVYERMHNGNVATINELGYTERSSHKENMIPAGDMGYITVRDINEESMFFGVTFNIGTGFTAAEREEFWTFREKYIGKIVKYAFFPIGVKDKPRHPSYLGFRNLIDMGN